MRTVFNYRQALREPKKIQQITEKYSLPFSIELIPAINFLVFLTIMGFFLYLLRTVFPYLLEWTFLVFLIGIPLLLTSIMRKIQPDGKNIYLYLYDFAKYLFWVKLPKKYFCHDKKVAWMHDKIIQFRKCVKVVDKSERIKNANENNERQPVINANGRRVGVVSYSDNIHSEAK
ncbi:conjugal transfer protein [Virgibacillus sp. NKC19-16]|uniref:conjugal transfer protein n=1 Tax=Virgibacillus salidurans TaxID=2831673 RepID=UPI001F421597|nr:conjugal transfer protein [Virgibacillus sp. NKC19-16]UJL47092.1 conjugal transfer protein [Virgibacillus sp. NKC19-16]